MAGFQSRMVRRGGEQVYVRTQAEYDKAIANGFVEFTEVDKNQPFDRGGLSIDDIVNAPALRAAYAAPRDGGILLGTSPQTNTLAAFQEFNALVAPRALDYAMYFSSFPTDPVGFTGWWTESHSIGAVPAVTWSGKAPLSQVLDGTKDAQLTAAVNRVKAAPGIVSVRLFHEFNVRGYPYGTSAETAAQFIAGWRYVVDFFRTRGVTNVQWGWTPNVWLNSGGLVDDPRGYYPGDDYVDFIGIDGYLSNLEPSEWSFETLFLGEYRAVCAISTRPFWVAEVGASSTRGGFTAAERAEWIKAMFATVRTKMPRTVALCWWSRDEYVLSGDALTAFTAAVRTAPMIGPKFTGGGGASAPGAQLATYSTPGTYTWTKPDGCTRVQIDVIGGGGGGGSGRRGAAVSARAGGGGASGGAMTSRTLVALDVPDAATVVVGAGGAGGAATSTDNTNGTTGGNGGNSSFDVHRAGGGNNGGGGAAINGTSNFGGSGQFGGGNGSTTNVTGAAGAGGSNPGAGGGGGGGSIGANDTVYAAGNGGTTNTTLHAAATGGNAGQAGGAATPGSGGAGGAASATAAAQAGGNGGAPGGAGGGGGASLNGFASGKGGDGAPGSVRVIAYFD